MQSQQGRGARLGRWLSDNWLELALMLVLLAAVAWLARTGYAIWSIAHPEPAPTPLPRIEVATQTPAPRPAPTSIANEFDAAQAREFANALMALGPRIAGSAEVDRAAEIIAQELRKEGWQVEDQVFEVNGVQMRNVIGRAGSGPPLIVAAPFDTAPVAEVNAESSANPAPAEDSANSAAVLLELARSLDKDKLQATVWLAFLDGQYPPASQGAEPISAGARHLAASLQPETLPQAVLLLDVVDDGNRPFYYELNSDPALSEAVWNVAKELGFDQWFVPETRYTLDNGVIAFRDRGVPAANIANHDYTAQSQPAGTPPAIAAGSLERIGRVLEATIEGANRGQ